MSERHALEEEIGRLRARLAEAEETLLAIRSGAVDALVVQSPDGDQVFTLKGAEEPYRILVERMREGALTLTADGTVVYGNRRFAELVGLPLEQVVGKTISAFVAAEQRSALEELLNEAGKGGERRELQFTRGDGSVFPALVSVSPLPMDGVAALSTIVTDLTEQKRNEEIAAAERFARSILEQATDPVIVCDRAGRITHISQAAEQLSSKPPVGLTLSEAFSLEFGETYAGAAGSPTSVEAWIDTALKGASVHGVEVRPAKGGAGDEEHFLLSVGPLYNGREEPVGCIVTLTNITDRKRAEERQRFLLAELSHRVKNNLAIVRSVASQTLQSCASLDVFEESFNGRLKALSLAHSILTQTGWGRADLAQLVVQSVAPYHGFGEAEDGLTVSGPPVFLPSQTVLPLAMIFHELATNAAKYGALSVESGRIDVVWELELDGARPQVRLSWAERNGPPVKPPTRRGFGSNLLTRTASYDLDGEAELEYRQDGLRYLAVFPLPSETDTVLGQATSMAKAGS